MTDQNPRIPVGVLVLAGVGAGTLAGVMMGLLALRRPRGQSPEEISETVDDLKRRAEMILTELSRQAPNSGA